MIEWLALIIFFMAGMVIVYHHIGYPIALKLLTKGLENTLPSFYHDTTTSRLLIICCQASV